MIKRSVQVLLVVVLFLITAGAALAYDRPYSVVSISEPQEINFSTQRIVEFDTGEQVVVGCGFGVQPVIGSVDSFWRAYWSSDFPFYHSAGFTQEGSSGVVAYDEYR